MQTATTSTQGLILSLASTLPPSTSLARRARRLADRLGSHPSRRLEERASDLLVRLLDATDCAELAGFAEDGCLDQEFDS